MRLGYQDRRRWRTVGAAARRQSLVPGELRARAAEPATKDHARTVEPLAGHDLFGVDAHHALRTSTGIRASTACRMQSHVPRLSGAGKATHKTLCPSGALPWSTRQ